MAPPQLPAQPQEHRLLTDPLLGVPLLFYVDSDVLDRAAVLDAITSNGGAISPAYNPVSFILVNPHTERAQQLARQHAAKPNKIVLDAVWIQKCIEANTILAYTHNWANLKILATVPTQLVSDQAQRQHTHPHPLSHPHPHPLPHQPEQHHLHHHQQQAVQRSPRQLPAPPLVSRLRPQTAPHAHHAQQQQQPISYTLQQGPGIPGPSGMQATYVPSYPAAQRWADPGVAPFPGQRVVTSAIVNHVSPWRPQQHHQQFAQPPTHALFPAPNGQHPGHFGHGPPPFHPQDTYYDYRGADPHWEHAQPEQFYHAPGVSFGGPHTVSAEHTHAPPPFLPAPTNAHGPTAPPPDLDVDVDGNMDVDMEPPPPPPPPPMLGDGDGGGVEDDIDDDGDDENERDDELADDGDERRPASRHTLSDEPDEPPAKKRKRSKPSGPNDSHNDPGRLIAPRAPRARSPTPPTEVMKSTFGGNHFTEADIQYLHKYIEYCQDQGMALSLREICERVAQKAPHHTFYSWRRYCNKHQIRLGAYMMINTSETVRGNRDDGDELDGDERDRRDRDADDEVDELNQSRSRSSEQEVADNAHRDLRLPAAPSAVVQPATSTSNITLNRTPSPPRELYRSTTGKGVAFTDDDVKFLVNYLAYRRQKDGPDMDMVSFWRDVAQKAPHHSRASWMKYWRRHKHEIEPADGDEPLPERPAKKMRYSKEDDVLLAKHCISTRDGTSDQIFQNFARLHPHHPWKGWQEHYRIHRAEIERMSEQFKPSDTAGT